MRAIVLVSGGAAVTPFTTPSAAADAGMAAGNTMTALRAHLLAAGHTVFTAPARVGAGVVRSDDGWQGFSDVPEVLPAAMTVNSAGRIDDAGTALAAFLAHVTDAYAVDAIDIVAHSMGGLFTRAALGALGAPGAGTRGGSTPPVARLVTLGTPWTGSLLGDVRRGDILLADAHDDTATAAILTQSLAFADQVSQGAADEVSHSFLAGDDGWNAGQRGVLDDIEVTLVGGDRFAAYEEPSRLWPHDGLVATRSALGEEVPAEVLPHRSVHRVDDVHSIFFADRFDLPWERALTWDPRVFDIVDAALGSGA
ncbi:esterase/lipase family protein [Microbacterium flavum]|uniref:Alpha/beta hydrolase n=1 Tax=Microbacterium flavum TaxID=415216 RepID=A0ABS5XUC0_9MICO|nr:alpha/beta hydrolase [Microbacterium flavum]MBT8798132.1 alpha/beta hydrolase [Microbacterium flavum]